MDEVAIEAIKKAITCLDQEIEPNRKYMERLNTLCESRDALKALLDAALSVSRADGEMSS